MTRTIDLNHILCENPIDIDLFDYLRELGLHENGLTDLYESVSNFQFNLTDTDFSLRIEE